MPKEKLTLSVDREVVNKAKSLGLNISDITELALKGFTFSSKEADRSSLYESYGKLFAAMKPLLKEYGVSVRIASEDVIDEQTGNPMANVNIYLCSDGTFFEDLSDTTFSDIRKIGVDTFCTTTQILSNLVKALAESVPKRREALRELAMAERIVGAIAATLRNGAETKIKSRIRRGRVKSRVM